MLLLLGLVCESSDSALLLTSILCPQNRCLAIHNHLFNNNGSNTFFMVYRRIISQHPYFAVLFFQKFYFTQLKNSNSMILCAFLIYYIYYAKPIKLQDFYSILCLYLGKKEYRKFLYFSIIWQVKQNCNMIQWVQHSTATRLSLSLDYVFISFGSYHNITNHNQTSVDFLKFKGIILKTHSLMLLARPVSKAWKGAYRTNSGHAEIK